MTLEKKPVFNLSKKNDWETPNELYSMACEFFGVEPVLDVAATAENSKCKWHYSEGGLDKPYEVDFFCNPPYDQLKKWIRKCYLEHVKNNVNGLMLIFNKTDTKAFHQYIFGHAEVLFVQGRVHFWVNGMASKNPAPYGSCFVLFRRKIDL